MEFFEIVEPYESRRTVFTIYPICDTHYGLAGTEEDEILKTVKAIERDKNARWIGLGEMCDLIVPGDKRWDPAMMAPWVDHLDVAQSEEDRFLDAFRPIKDKCWGLLNDNHSESMRTQINRDVYSDLVRELGKDLPEEKKPKRLEFECFLNVAFQRQAGDGRKPGNVIHFWFHHGWFGGRLMGETALNLERLPQSYDADIYIVAHGHKALIIPLDHLTARYGDGAHADVKPIRMQRWAMMAGSWVNAHKIGKRSWAERRGFKPQPIGCPIIKIKPSARRIEIVTGGNL